jgi:hypothetical protein
VEILGNRVLRSSAKDVDIGQRGCALDMGWNVEIAHRWTRAEQQERFGGGPQGGIVPSRRSPKIFIYSDVESGHQYGYVFDGWNEDNTIFLYTGEGAYGNQQMVRMNRAILEHESAGRALRLFVADGTESGSGTKIHQYIGEFGLDISQPYETRTGPDRYGDPRDVIVFRLTPRSTTLVRGGDESQEPNAPGLTEIADLESILVDSFTVARQGSVSALRREGAMVRRYATWLAGQESYSPLVRHKIRLPNKSGVLYTDGWIAEECELIEAKFQSGRDAVRTGLGQLLDYERFIEPRPRILTLLLASRPQDDLVDLLHSHGVGVVYETRTGIFTRESAPK